MNHCVPDWSMDDDLRAFNDLFPQSNEKKSVASDNELVELLWRNGHVVRQSQSNRKPSPNVGELKQPQKPNPQPKPIAPLVNAISNPILEDDPAMWFQYPLEDSLEFLCEMPVLDTVDPNKPNKQFIREEDVKAFTVPPPKSHVGGGPVNFSHFSRPVKADMGGSLKSASSSVCGSNQVQNQNDRVPGKGLKEVGPMISPREGVGASTFDTTVTSSSGGSGCSFGRTTTRQQSAGNLKRKGRDGEESECHSEEAEYESIEANRPTQRPASTRKSRAAEVHNLSERRRRDRINEKMRALQELIPHCNKSDKASMLDEAIEYLKSLQLQLQFMWMGSGMTPMMFPGVQRYMPRVVNNPIQLSRNPLLVNNHSSTNQIPMCTSQSVNPINFPAQMQNVHLPESYARFFGGFPHMQLPPQAMNLYTYGSHTVQQNQTASSSLLTAVIPSENVQNGPSG